MKTATFIRTGFLAASTVFRNNNHHHHSRTTTTTTTTIANTRLGMASASSPSTTTARVGIDYPELVVFDLDACLWDQEMYEMRAMPDRTVKGDLGNGYGEGVIGAYSGHDKISLHKGSLIALQEHSDNKYPGMKICFASSADTPFAEKVGRATLKLLEVQPGLTVWDLVMRDWDNQDVNQIGRQPPLSRYVF
jgi:magnesium-dependent phosphatase 1